MKFLLLALTLLFPATAPAAPPTIAAGWASSYATDRDGITFGWGYNDAEQFDFQSAVAVGSPIRLRPSLRTGVQSISSGGGHTLFLNRWGEVFGTGYCGLGQLGIGAMLNDAYISEPVSIIGDVKAIAAGGNHSIFLLKDGSAWVCGDDNSGQLGLGRPKDVRITPVKVLTGIKAISAGHAHSLFLTTGGRALAAGRNESGQLGDGTQAIRATPIHIMDQVRAISASGNHSLFLRTDGSVWATGSNGHGQLGTAGDRITSPVRVMTGVEAVVAGSETSFFIKSNGDLWATGRNNYGQLGDGTITERNSPVRVLADVAEVATKANHTIVKKKDGSVWATGSNYYGQLGNNGWMDRSWFAEVPGFSKTSQPEIDVWQAGGTTLKDGISSKSLGTSSVGKNGVTRTYIIRNTGIKALKGLKITTSGPHAGDFTFTTPPVALKPGQTTTFKVTFKPSKTGTRTATLHIRSNDSDESPFDIRLTGYGTLR